MKEAWISQTQNNKKLIHSIKLLATINYVSIFDAKTKPFSVGISHEYDYDKQ